MRTRDTHASHLGDLHTPLHNHIATTYGVAEQCRYFHVHVVDGLVPDIMHDLLEGSAHLLTLRYLDS